MEKYIDADRLKAEIEDRRREFINKGEQDLHDAEVIRRSTISSCNDFLYLIASLRHKKPKQVKKQSKMAREKIILDNHSSKPLYESYEKAFDCYFENWGEDCKNFDMSWGDFIFHVRTNNSSITIKIFDINS